MKGSFEIVAPTMSGSSYSYFCYQFYLNVLSLEHFAIKLRVEREWKFPWKIGIFSYLHGYWVMEFPRAFGGRAENFQCFALFILSDIFLCNDFQLFLIPIIKLTLQFRVVYSCHPIQFNLNEINVRVNSIEK